MDKLIQVEMIESCLSQANLDQVKWVLVKCWGKSAFVGQQNLVKVTNMAERIQILAYLGQSCTLTWNPDLINLNQLVSLVPGWTTLDVVCTAVQESVSILALLIIRNLQIGFSPISYAPNYDFSKFSCNPVKIQTPKYMSKGKGRSRAWWTVHAVHLDPQKIAENLKKKKKRIKKFLYFS